MKNLLTLALALLSTAAFAFPQAKFDALKTNLAVDAYQALNYNFEGIVKLSNCSGALVAFNGQPLTSKAIVMTNGHCVEKPGGFLNPGEVWVNRAKSRAMKLFDANMKLTKIKATKILYATMTNTDVAFYELDETYSEIYKRSNIRPYLMDPIRPFLGTSIEIISGYWDRGYSCDIDGFVYRMKEADWTFTDAIRYTATGCNTIGGTSGSPVIEQGTRKVIAINNTGNKSGDRCTMNNPCEIDEQGEVSVKKGASYAQQTYNAYSCLTVDFKFDLNKAGCTLPR